MKHIATFTLLGMLSVLPSPGQANQTDSQTLQSILVEIRGLHNDVRLSETTQILLTELEIQQTAVNRAMQRRDDVQAKASQAHESQVHIAAQLAQFEELGNTTIDPAQKKQMTQMQEQIKSQMAMLKGQEPGRTNDLLEAESALRKEQNTLSGIQDQLNDVVKKLQPTITR